MLRITCLWKCWSELSWPRACLVSYHRIVTSTVAVVALFLSCIYLHRYILIREWWQFRFDSVWTSHRQSSNIWGFLRQPIHSRFIRTNPWQIQLDLILKNIYFLRVDMVVSRHGTDLIERIWYRLDLLHRHVLLVIDLWQQGSIKWDFFWSSQLWYSFETFVCVSLRLICHLLFFKNNIKDL